MAAITFDVIKSEPCFSIIKPSISYKTSMKRKIEGNKVRGEKAQTGIKSWRFNINTLFGICLIIKSAVVSLYIYTVRVIHFLINAVKGK